MASCQILLKDNTTFRKCILHIWRWITSMYKLLFIIPWTGKSDATSLKLKHPQNIFFRVFYLLVDVSWFYTLSHTPSHTRNMLSSYNKTIFFEKNTFFQPSRVQFLHLLAEASFLLFVFCVKSCFVFGLLAILPASTGRFLIEELLRWTPWSTMSLQITTGFPGIWYAAPKKHLVFSCRNFWTFGHISIFRSYIANLELKLFSQVWGSPSSHICFLIGLVFHQHLNSHIGYLDSPPEPSNHTRRQFLHLPLHPLLRLLWSKSDNKVTKKRIFDQYHTGTPRSSTALH